MKVIFDDAEFSRVIKGSAGSVDASEVAVVVREHGTEQGNPVAAFTFLVRTENGPLRVQATSTVRSFLLLAAALRGKFEHLDLEAPVPLPENAPKTIRGIVDGVGYDAVLMERVYLVHADGSGIGIATTEAEIPVIAKALDSRRVR